MLNRMLVNYDDSKISGRGALKLVGYIPFNQGFTKPGSKDLGIVANDRTIVLFMMFLHSHLCWPSLVSMQACLIP